MDVGGAMGGTGALPTMYMTAPLASKPAWRWLQVVDE